MKCPKKTAYILITFIFCTSKLLAQENTLIPNSEFFTPYWAGAAYHYGDNSGRYYCAISTLDSNGDVFLLSVESDFKSIAVSINSATLGKHQQNDTIPVSLQIDSKKPIYANMQILAANFGKIVLNDNFRENVNKLQKGKTLVITSRNWRMRLPLIGSYNGLEAAKQCIIQNSNPTGNTQAPLQPLADKTLAYQIATTTISKNGLSDFKFLTEQERARKGWADGVAWTAESNNINGLVTIGTGHNGLLSSSDANDIHWLASFCSGDYLTSARDVEDVKDFKMRELILLCNSKTGQNHTAYLTKSLLGELVIYQVVTVLDAQEDNNWYDQEFRNDLAVASAKVLAKYKN